MLLATEPFLSPLTEALFYFVCLFYFETGFLCITDPWMSRTHFIDQAGLDLIEIHPPLPPECCD